MKTLQDVKLESEATEMVKAVLGEQTLRAKYGSDADGVVQALVMNIVRMVKDSNND